MTPDPAPEPLLPITFPDEIVPAPDPAAEPEGFLVTTDDGTRIHFLDWGGPATPVRADPGAPGILLVPGLLSVAWSWAPVARRLRVERRTVVADLRGHGLSDAPSGGYDLATLAADVVVVAEGSGALDGGRVVLAGHGFGAVGWPPLPQRPSGGGAPAWCSSTAAGSAWRRRPGWMWTSSCAASTSRRRSFARSTPGWRTGAGSTRRPGMWTRSGPRATPWWRRPPAMSSGP